MRPLQRGRGSPDREDQCNGPQGPRARARAAPRARALQWPCANVMLAWSRQVVRIAARSRESVLSSVHHLCLHSMVAAMRCVHARVLLLLLCFSDSPMYVSSPDKSELRKLRQLRDDVGELSAGDERRLRALIRQTERELLQVGEAAAAHCGRTLERTVHARAQAADVICCTCSGAGDMRLKNFRFRQVLIDEATQVGACAGWSDAATSASRQPVSYAGDRAGVPDPHLAGRQAVGSCWRPLPAGPSCDVQESRQGRELLLPTFSCAHCLSMPCVRVALQGFTQSMFERLVLLGVRPIRLQVRLRRVRGS